jgi:hypothetical protein
MEIKISRPAERTVYPDIAGNLDLPEDERFAVVLRKPSDQKIADESIEMVYGENGELEQRYNWRGAARAYIHRLVNAPQVNVDGRKRDLRVQDIFRYDELQPVLKAVNDEIAAMRDEQEESATKNS